MKQHWKTIALIGGITVVVLAVALYQIGRRAAMGSEATATVTGVAYEPAKDFSGTADDTDEATTIAYRYPAGGKTFEASTRLSTDARGTYRRGQPVAVCYDPQAPEESELKATFDGKCGG